MILGLGGVKDGGGVSEGAEEGGEVKTKKSIGYKLNAFARRTEQRLVSAMDSKSAGEGSKVGLMG